jgi:predicted nucleic acid-binding protein
MILVDTSVLIDYLKGKENEKVSLFQQVIERGIPFGISNIIYLEILQGARTTGEFNKLKEYLESLEFFEISGNKESYENIAKLNIQCRSSGVTVRSTIDLTISQIAIENNLLLLHNDRDFDRIASVVRSLKILNKLDFT